MGNFFWTIRGRLTVSFFALSTLFLAFSAYLLYENNTIKVLFRYLSVAYEPGIALNFIAKEHLCRTLNSVFDDFLIRDTIHFKENLYSRKQITIILQNLKVRCDSVELYSYGDTLSKIKPVLQVYFSSLDSLYALILDKSVSRDSIRTFYYGHTRVLFWKSYDVISKGSILFASQKSSISNSVRFRTARIVWILIVFLVLFLAITFISWRSLYAYIADSVKVITQHLSQISKGELHFFHSRRKDEIQIILDSSNTVVSNLSKASEFAISIGKSQFDVAFTPVSDTDQLGKSLLKMRDELHKLKSEDSQRIWINEGYSHLGDIIRSNSKNLRDASQAFIAALVKYVAAVSGAVYVLQETKSKEKYLELLGAYASGRNKNLHERVSLTDGWIGQVYTQAKRKYFVQVPEDYIKLGSGLGEALPASVLIVPAMADDKVLAVVEMASFNEFQAHQIEFVEKISSNFASVLYIAKQNEQNDLLIEELTIRTEQMRSQEEELRQNMEELLATQEEMYKRSEDFKEFANAINSFNIIIELFPDGTIAHVNDKFCEFTGYQREEIVGQKHTYYVPHEAIVDGAFEKLWSLLRTGENIIRDVLRMKKDGSRFWLRACYMPVLDKNGKIKKISCVCFDITDFKSTSG